MDKIPVIKTNRDILAKTTCADTLTEDFNSDVRRILTAALDEILAKAPPTYDVGAMINVTRKFRSLRDTIEDGAIAGSMNSAAKKRKVADEEAAPDAAQASAEASKE